MGKGGTPLVVPVRALDERRQTCRQADESVGFVDQRCCAAVAWVRWPAAQGFVCGVGTVTGHPVNSPARHFTVIPHSEGLLALDTTRT